MEPPAIPGRFTDAVNWKAKQLGALEISHYYVEALASAIGGDVNKDFKDGHWYVSVGGSVPTIGDLLSHADAWRDAIEHFTKGITQLVEP
jgi:hypothetical protein